jgi:hypothetical protein
VKLVDKSPAKDPDLVQFQDRVRAAVNPVLANPLLDGRIIDVTLNPTGNTTLIEHKLGRNITGWFVVDLTVSTSVWRVTTAHPDKFLELEQTAAVEVPMKIYVF